MLLSLQLEEVETLKYRCVSASVRFNIVSNDHGRTQKCDFCISVCKTNFTDHHKPGGCLSNNWKHSFLPFLFASSIYLAYIFEASYYTLVMSVRKKSSADLSEFEKYVVPNCIQYSFRDSVLVCKMHDCYCTICKYFENFLSLPSSSDASDCNY